MTQMTMELLRQTLPKALQGNATQELADKINNIALDPEVADEVRANFLSYTKVLQDGKFKTETYLDAVTYVTHKLMGYSNQDAWVRTFPQRYQTLVARGETPKTISAHVAAYHANKLVNLILEQSIIPSWLLNRDIYQRAINTQFDLMTDPDVSPKVRSDAANSILTHLKQPEAQKIELEVSTKEDAGVADLMATMRQLAAQQRELIASGVPAAAVARQKLVGSSQQQVLEDVPYREVERVVEKVVQSTPSPSLLLQASTPESLFSDEAETSTQPGVATASAASPAPNTEGGGAVSGEEEKKVVAGATPSAGAAAISLFGPIP